MVKAKMTLVSSLTDVVEWGASAKTALTGQKTSDRASYH